MMTERLTELFTRHLDRRLTSDERVELMGLFLEPSLQSQLAQLVEETWEQTGEDEGMPKEKKQALLQKIFEPEKTEVPVIEIKRHQKMFGWKRWSVAASIILLLGAGGYLLFVNKNDKPDEIVKTTVPDDIKAPKTNKAMITLENGQNIFLDSVGNGELAKQGNIKLVKLANGQIAYKTTTGEIIKSLQYNTLFNPRGSKVIDMTLADGSRVWLNAGSSVKYPISFAGNDRKVEITGEAYFEVSHDPAKPFIVSNRQTSITVLGTHFNVNAYEDEPNLKVTLLEGSVIVNSTKIRPGQQAIVDKIVHVSDNIDIDAVMAWKNGKFSFNRSDIQTVMRELARWYDLDVEFKGPPTKDLFGGDMQRSLPFSKVLEFLKKSQVNFKVDGNKVIVSPLESH